MKRLFADTYYYVALLSPEDESHANAIALTDSFDGEIVTTAWVLVELANALARGHGRMTFVSFFRDLQTDLQVEIVPPVEHDFSAGLDMYANRADKNWSLTECISFVVMQQRGITDALTGDHHFEQAGFNIAFK